MTVRLRPGLVLQLPSRNAVRVVKLDGREATVEYVFWSQPKGEVVFTVSWLSRHSVVIDRGRNR